MKIDGVHHRSIWLSDDGWSVRIFDQRQLPWRVEISGNRSATLPSGLDINSAETFRSTPVM